MTECTPTRRALRHGFLLEAGATLATALDVTAAVLAPDPVWIAPAADAGADAALIALCRRTLVTNAAFELHAGCWSDTVRVPADVRAEEHRLCHAAADLVKQVGALSACIASGLHAKAAVVHAWWGDTLEAGPASLVADVLRLTDAQMRA